MPWRTDIERHRVRRTLSEVKRKLEEALQLSKRNGGSASPANGVHGEINGEQTLTHRHR
jgi:hypothetical protein